VLCIGETEAEREAGATLARLDAQLAGSLPDGVTAERLVVAYEPVWAIGTGRTATLDDIGAAHAQVRRRLGELMPDGAAVPLLYGGSVRAGNAGAILAQRAVDGALVGGASLDADEFWAIYTAGGGA
jgi:triosephosphate isomerase